MYELTTLDREFLKEEPYLRAIDGRLSLINHYSLASFLLVYPSPSDTAKTRISRLWIFECFYVNT